MSQTVPLPTGPEANAAKSKAALSSLLWSGLLTLLKVAAAISSNSLAMLSEALDSALDLIAAGITFVAVRIAAIPADTSHPFGHGKVENLSALAETVLLFLTCGWIVSEALSRLLFHAEPVQPSWWVFGVIIISLVVNVNRSAMLRRVAKKHRSQAIEADALHFTTDVLSSSVVLVGLACVAVANQLEPGSTLRLVLSKADAVAALGVAGIVLTVSWRLAVRAVRALMDGGSEKEAKMLRHYLAENAPAYQIRQVRVRESGAQYFVDLTVAAPSSLRVDAAHDISAMLEGLIAHALPGADTTVHIEPADNEAQRDFYASSHHLASLHGLSVHGLALITLSDGLHVFVHIELDPDMSLEEAHARVSAYEQDLAQRVGAVHVVSHIEPSRRQVAGEALMETPADHAMVLEVLHKLMQTQTCLADSHDEEVWTEGNITSLSFRCRTNCAATVAVAHQLASRLEAELRRELPGLGRITIHVEPQQVLTLKT